MNKHDPQLSASVVRNYWLIAENNRLQRGIDQIRSKLQLEIDAIDQIKAVRMSGWSVLLKRAGDSFEFVAIVNPDKDDNIPEDGWDLCLPIPEMGTVKDFEGF
jgi:hypothetical protein